MTSSVASILVWSYLLKIQRNSEKYVCYQEEIVGSLLIETENIKYMLWKEILFSFLGMRTVCFPVAVAFTQIKSNLKISLLYHAIL